MTNRVF